MSVFITFNNFNGRTLSLINQIKLLANHEK